MSKVKIIPITVPDDFGLESLGCSLEIYDDKANLADLLEAIDLFASQYIADCKGCDGCCKERAPLIAADIPALASLLPSSPYPAHAVCTAFAELNVDKRGAVDICFSRDINNACVLLNKKEKCCTNHPARAFVCRSHFCLPRSEVFDQLREEVVNIGENELTRLLLAEEALGAPPFCKTNTLGLLSPEDYPPNPQSGKASYADIIIKETVSDKLWKQIKKEGN